MTKHIVNMDLADSYLIPEWSAPRNIRAVCTTRMGGFCRDEYKSFNLALHVDDDPKKVLLNRAKLVQDLNLLHQPMWLNQVHGNLCVRAGTNTGGTSLVEADASYSTQANIACVVMTADCLPILFTDKKGLWVAACHAGWRGLAQGVIQNTIDQFPGKASELLAWIGPAIGEKYFEVGNEVKQQFIQIEPIYEAYFKPNQNQRFQFDFAGLAKDMLSRLEIETFGGDWCTYQQSERFYSYRRDVQTGRMASLIWIDN